MFSRTPTVIEGKRIGWRAHGAVWPHMQVPVSVTPPIPRREQSQLATHGA
ncbi:MAG TPA: hypothetical protein VGR13_01160 [Actinomycetota bacterium]|nr:hypothetical protein [Actinomycetota bacterium]